MPRPVMRQFLTLTFLSTVLILSGCASRGDTGEAPTESEATGPSLLKQGKSVGDVSVSLDNTVLAEDVVAVAEQFSVASKLDSSLRDRDQVGSGGLALDVKVVSMRLRSVGNAIGLGLMSGVDFIAIKVAVTEDGAVVKEFEERSSNSLGGFAYGGREKRVDRMIRDLTNRILNRV